MIIYVIFVDGLLHGVILIVTLFSSLLISLLAVAFFLQNNLFLILLTPLCSLYMCIK